VGGVVLTVITAALWAGVTNRVVQLSRVPEDLPSRAMLACLGCVAVMFSLSLPPVRAALDGVSPGLRVLTVNLGTMTAAYFLLAFFTYSVRGPAGRRAVRLQALPLLGAAAVAATAWYLAPGHVRIAPADPANGADRHATVFLLAVLGYMAHAHLLTLRWSVAYARIARLARLRRGLVVICLALAALLCADLTKATLAVAQAFGVVGPPAVGLLQPTYLAFVGVGTLAFVVGVSYPAVAGMAAAVAIWRAHRRYHRELWPLWDAMHREFPQLALSRLPHRQGFGWRGTHRRFYRRVIEIRDGLVQLSPYYDRAAAERAAEAARRAGRSGSDVDDVVRATLIADALWTKRGGAPVVEAEAIALPGGSDLESDARSLVRVARIIAPMLAGRPPTGRADRPPAPDPAAP